MIKCMFCYQLNASVHNRLWYVGLQYKVHKMLLLFHMLMLLSSICSSFASTLAAMWKCGTSMLRNGALMQAWCIAKTVASAVVQSQTVLPTSHSSIFLSCNCWFQMMCLSCSVQESQLANNWTREIFKHHLWTKRQWSSAIERVIRHHFFFSPCLHCCCGTAVTPACEDVKFVEIITSASVSHKRKYFLLVASAAQGRLPV